MGSRPCESRNDLLNRWVRKQRLENMEKSWEKPSDPGTVQSLAVCERWRKRICQDIDAKLDRLYNEPLPEAETKHLNTEVNNILKEIRRWEIRILELGGIDYSRVSLKTSTGDLLNTNGNRYQYFGRARELPGVKELLEAEQQQRANASFRVNKESLMERVDPSYYGVFDDADLEEQEMAIEREHGVMTSEPDLNTAPIPSDDAIMDAVRQILAGDLAEAVV